MNLASLRDLAHRAVHAYDPPPGTFPLKDRLGQNRGFMTSNTDSVTIAVRGTSTLKDALIDADLAQKHTREGFVHKGFWTEYLSIAEEIGRFMAAFPGKVVRVAGHSMGGAIATYVAEHAASLGRDVELVTLGSPRAGDHDFANLFNRHCIDGVRIVHAYDIVPRVPKLWYRHVEGLLHIDRKGGEIKDTRGFFGELLYAGKVALADLTRKALDDHSSMAYLCALEDYIKTAKGGNP